MNFKTTAVLLVLLLAGGAYLLFTRDKPAGDADRPTPLPPAVLAGVTSADVTGLLIADAAGKPVLAVERVSDKSAATPLWRLTKPVDAPADPSKVASLVDELTGLHPTSTISAAAADAKAAVAKPQYTVTLTTAAKATTLLVGDRLAVGDGVYVQPALSDTVSVVSPTLLDTLARPASDLRNAQLVTATPADIKQLTLTRADGSKLSLAKDGTTWRITAPTPAPADATAVDDLLYAVTGLTVSAFVNDPASAIGLTHPQAVVAFSTAAPTTAPTTGPATAPAMTTVTLGGYATVEKKDVYAAVSDGSVVRVAGTVLDSLNKTELDLRDKAVVDLDPAKVTKLTIAAETPATIRPTTHPASAKTIVLARRPPAPVLMGPAKPTTGPASQPAVPPKPATVWTVDGADADDAKVTAFLAQFHPLRADKFLADSLIKNPDRRFTLTVTAGPTAPVVVTIADPGHDLSLVGSAAGLTFNLPATMAADLAGDFKKSDAPAPPAPSFGGGGALH